MSCLFTIVATTQGINVDTTQFDALGDMLSSARWDSPQAQEYKNDLQQPEFLGVMGIPTSASQSIVPQPPKLDPSAPANDDQWKKINKMVA